MRAFVKALMSYEQNFIITLGRFINIFCVNKGVKCKLSVAYEVLFKVFDNHQYLTHRKRHTIHMAFVHGRNMALYIWEFVLNLLIYF